MQETIQALYKKIEEALPEHPDWVRIFRNCFSNTLEKALVPMDDGGIFVLTGDIPAMWLRDSSAQLRPYIFLAAEDERMRELICRVIRTQISCILHDPYANAFNQNADGRGHGATDHTEMSPFIWERKYEVDSLCYPMQLAYLLYANTGETAHFTRDFYTAMKRIYELWKLEQCHEHSPYRFERDTDRDRDTLVEDGRGPRCAYTGMTWSGFRPSDDHCEFSYLIPSNMFAVVVLGYMAEIAVDIYGDAELAGRCRELAAQIDEGIKRYGIVETGTGEAVYAFEVDGLGHYKLMDDGNVPNLLSAPYLGYAVDTEVYKRTLEWIFSPRNPYFYQGSHAAGLGSSHTWEHYIWHISMAMEGLVSSSREKKAEILDRMAATDGGTGFMHESFDVNDPTRYTREWFSWPNMLFCELVLDYMGLRLRR